MKSLKFKRNMLMLLGGVAIASIQLGFILYKGMDATNIISFTIIQFMYMDMIKETFDTKMEESNGK